MSNTTERRASFGLRIAFRVFINIGTVFLLTVYLGDFFVLQGGLQAIAIAGLILTTINFLVVPLLNVLSFPIKFVAWIVAFLLVNAAALWLTREIITVLAVPGVSLDIEGGIVGWIVASAVLGMGNWLVRAIVK